MKIAYTAFLLLKCVGGVTGALVTLPLYRRRALRAFRRALRTKGLSNREIERLAALYKESLLDVRRAFALLKSFGGTK